MGYTEPQEDQPLEGLAWTSWDFRWFPDAWCNLGLWQGSQIVAAQWVGTWLQITHKLHEWQFCYYHEPHSLNLAKQSRHYTDAEAGLARPSHTGPSHRIRTQIP